jgi:hypothetical protein
MDELIRQMIAQAPAVAVILYLVVRLDRRLEELQDTLIDLIKAEQAAAHEKSVEKKR